MTEDRPCRQPSKLALHQVLCREVVPLSCSTEGPGLQCFEASWLQACHGKDQDGGGGGSSQTLLLSLGLSPLEYLVP